MKLRVPVVKVSLKTIEFGKTAAPRRDRWWRRRPTTIIGSIVLIILAASLIWHALNGTNYGQVALTTEDSSPTPKVLEYQTLTTNYYSVNYPGRYTQQATDIAPSGILDQKVLTYNLGANSGKSQIEIDIKSAPYGGITLDSSYDYYVKRLDQYKMTSKYYHGEAIDIARSTKGTPETAGLWLHAGFIMVAKITTPDKNQNIDVELKDLLSSVQWRD